MLTLGLAPSMVLVSYRKKVLQVLGTHKIMFVSFRQLNCRYPNCGHCLRKKTLFFSHGSTALMRIICLVTYECFTEVEDMLVSPWLDRSGFSVYWIWDRGGFKCYFLLVCGMVQNQRSLQSWGKAWLLAWQYQHLTAEINRVWVFSHRCCVQGKPRTERSLHLWYKISVHKESVAPSGSQVHVLSVQSSVRLLQRIITVQRLNH